MESNQKNRLNRYVKVKGHSNWFLVLEANNDEPDGLSELMQEKLLRSEACKIHEPNAKMDFTQRVTMVALRQIDYEALAKKYGTVLIRPIGSFMPMSHNEITDETFDTNFPVEDFGEIVICENDSTAEYGWVKYLENRFPDKKIVTINFFDLRSESEVEKYFKEAKYITFSTTFTKYNWFEKLSKYAKSHQQIIGYCHHEENWEQALKINPNVEIVKNIKNL